MSERVIMNEINPVPNWTRKTFVKLFKYLKEHLGFKYDNALCNAMKITAAQPTFSNWITESKETPPDGKILPYIWSYARRYPQLLNQFMSQNGLVITENSSPTKFKKRSTGLPEAIVPEYEFRTQSVDSQDGSSMTIFVN
jgi:hypothetical protein